MEMDVRDKKENKLLGRQEISFSVKYEKAMPSRKEMREALSTAMGANAELLVIKHASGTFGAKEAKGIAYLYSDKEAAQKEVKHLRVRDGLAAKEEKKKDKKAPAKK